MIGFSRDTSEKLAKCRAKHDLKCYLDADHDTEISEQSGVCVEKSVYCRTYMSIQRANFVFDANGKVAAVWPKVKGDGHAAKVLAFAQTM